MILTFLGSCDVINHVTIDTQWSTYNGWSILTVRLSGIIMEIWPLEVLSGWLFQKHRVVVDRSVVNITLISYTPLRYVRNVACEEPVHIIIQGSK